MATQRRNNKKSSNARKQNQRNSNQPVIDNGGRNHPKAMNDLPLVSIVTVAIVAACFWFFRDMLMVRSDQPLFVYLEEGLSKEPNISFDPSKLRYYTKDAAAGFPRTLAPPTYVKVFKYQHSSSRSCDLTNLGAAARELVDEHLSKSGAVLFRNLHKCIQTVNDFKIFWAGCVNSAANASLSTSNSSNCWTPMEYFPTGKRRPQIDGIDTPTNFPPRAIIECHNEMTYNPKPAGKIGFYCVQEALQGGETLLKKNADMTKIVAQETIDYIKSHGGILNERIMHDKENKPEHVKEARHGSWQDQIGAETVEEALKFLTDLGWAREDISIDPETTYMTVQYKGSGFIDNEDGSEQVWFSNVDMGNARCSDRTIIPKELQQYDRDKWLVTKSVKLRSGDWLVLDNRAVQHGRLPYQEDSQYERLLLDVYTE